MIKRTTAALAALLIVLPSVALAADPASTTPAPGAAPAAKAKQGKAKAKFHKADTDRDGFISREEAQKGMPKTAKSFDRIDTNGDGKLSREELRVHRQAAKKAKPAGNRATG